MSLKTLFILANTEDPDEIPSYAAFRLGLHCLLKYLFTGIQNEKGQANLMVIFLNFDKIILKQAPAFSKHLF